MTSDDRWATCFHEAGHAVAYLAFGWPFQYLSIDATDDLIGHILGQIPEGDPRCAIMHLAGCVAEARYSGVEYAHLLCHGGADDFCLAMDALSCHREQLSPAALLDQTKALVDMQWQNIILIANELARHSRRLSYKDVVEIIEAG
jgi:hypothetical protein